MKMVPLGELIRSAAVERAGAETYPILSMTMHHGLVDQTAKFKKAVASQNLSQYKVVRRGQLVVSFPIDEGVLGFQEIYAAAIVSPAYAVWDLVDDSRVDRSYLGKYLKSPKAIQYYRAKLRGSTARRRSLPKSVFLAHEVPLPPLDEQHRIAAILDKADAIRQMRRQAIAHLDALAQSIFHDMFGSPLTNNKGFRTAPIRHVSRVVTGSSPSRKDPSNFGSSVEWIKTDNLSGEIATVASECLSETAKEKARLAPAGSILVCCIAGSRNSIGKASMTDRQVSFNQQINAIIPADEIDPIFLLWQLKSAPELVRRKSTDGMKGLVNKTQFEAIEILVPHISKQKAFRNIAETISNHKRAYIGFEHKSSTLFESLQSRAFRGEL